MADSANISPRPRSMRFRRTLIGPKPTPDQARRQSEVANLAWHMLDGRDEIAAFLNTYQEALGGRPIDLAIASDAGFKNVETAMRARAAAQGRKLLDDANII